MQLLFVRCYIVKKNESEKIFDLLLASVGLHIVSVLMECEVGF